MTGPLFQNNGRRLLPMKRRWRGLCVPCSRRDAACLVERRSWKNSCSRHYAARGARVAHSGGGRHYCGFLYRQDQHLRHVLRG
jgi:hypothetical protein